MASEAELKLVAIKAIEDDSFRAAFDANPAAAVAPMGITLTAKQLADLKEAKAKADAAGDRLSKAYFVNGVGVVV